MRNLPSMTTNAYLRLLRPHQWVKQVFVFIPLLSLGEALDLKILSLGLCAVVTFTLMAGVVYILNDIADVEDDKDDIQRVKRPIASGEVGIPKAHLFQFIFIVLVIILTYLLSENAVISLAVLGIYLIINIFYSKLGLKKSNILGISIVSLGFPIRFAFGCLFCGIEISYWALSLLMQLALFMLSIKRYQRSVKVSHASKQSIFDFWLLAAIVFASAFSATYAGFISAPSTQIIWGSDYLLLSAIPVALAIVRFIELAFLKIDMRDDDVTETAYRDVPIILLVLIYCALMFAGSLTR